jgi:hypothetical protein
MNTQLDNGRNNKGYNYYNECWKEVEKEYKKTNKKQEKQRTPHKKFNTMYIIGAIILIYIAYSTKNGNTINTETLAQNIALLIYVLIIIALFKIIKFIISIPKKIYTAINSETQTNRNKWDDTEKTILHTKVSAGMPGREFIPNKQVLENFLRNPYNMDNLQAATNDILRHVNYTGPEPKVEYSLLGTDASTHIINECRAYITINSEPRKNSLILYALLIHECMNVVIFYNNINYGSVNKYLPAETMAIYKGYYQQIKNYSSYTSRKELEYIHNRIYK